MRQPLSPLPLAMASSRGFSLIEMMIAITVGLLIVAAVTGVFISNSSFRRSDARTSDLQSAGRYALEYLKRDLQHAGFTGMTAVVDFRATAANITAVPQDCVAGGGFVTNLSQSAWGTNNTNPFSATCIPAADYFTGDILVIRRLSIQNVAAFDAVLPYMRATYDRADFFMGSATPANFTVLGKIPFRDYQVETIVYHVRPYTVSSGENPKIPALWRLVLGRTSGGALGWNAEMIASGVENMRTLYGLYETDITTRFYTGNTVDAAATSITTTSNWDKLKTVKVDLLVRSATAEPGYSNTSTYNLGNSSVTVNDGFRRQAFTTAVNLRNR